MIKSFILSQNTVSLTTLRSSLYFRGEVTIKVLRCEVGADASADLPLLDVFAHGDDLACHIGARYEVL